MTADLVRWLPILAALIGLLQLMFLRVRPMPDPHPIHDLIVRLDTDEATLLAAQAQFALSASALKAALAEVGSVHTDPLVSPLRVFVADNSGIGYVVLTPVSDATLFAPPDPPAPPA